MTEINNKIFKHLKFVEPLSAKKRLFGQHRINSSGNNPEYFDTREYSPGDDFRHVAWNTYARLDKLYYNQLIDESNIKVSILLDSSKSMKLGNPQKLLYAKNIVLLLSRIARANNNQIEFYSFSKTLTKYGRFFTNNNFNNIKIILNKLNANGTTKIPGSFKESKKNEYKDITLVISDFLFQKKQLDSLLLLKKETKLMYAIQILSTDDILPDISDNQTIIDAEHATQIPIQQKTIAIKNYLATLSKHQNYMRKFCAKYNIRLIELVSNLSNASILSKFRIGGLLKH